MTITWSSKTENEDLIGEPELEWDPNTPSEIIWGGRSMQTLYVEEFKVVSTTSMEENKELCGSIFKNSNPQRKKKIKS